MGEGGRGVREGVGGGVAEGVEEDGVHPFEVEFDAEGRELVAHPFFSGVSTVSERVE